MGHQGGKPGGEIRQHRHVEEARGQAAVLKRVPTPRIRMGGNEAGDGHVAVFDGSAEGQLAVHEQRPVEQHVQQENGKRRERRGPPFHRLRSRSRNSPASTASEMPVSTQPTRSSSGIRNTSLISRSPGGASSSMKRLAPLRKRFPASPRQG